MDFFVKHSLCLPSTFEKLHDGDRSTHFSPILGYRRIDYVVLPVGWHAATTTSFVDRTVDLLSPGEDHFLTAASISGHFMSSDKKPVTKRRLTAKHVAACTPESQSFFGNSSILCQSHLGIWTSTRTRIA